MSCIESCKPRSRHEAGENEFKINEEPSLSTDSYRFNIDSTLELFVCIKFRQGMVIRLVREVKREFDTSSLEIAIVLSEFNEFVVENLLDGTVSVLEDAGVASDSITVYRVPGAFELPGTASQVLDCREPDGIVCLGAVIRGETPHFNYICSHVSSGIGNLSVESDVPVIFGVLTTDTRNQALHRSGSSGNNKGKESANALLETIGLYNSIK